MVCFVGKRIFMIEVLICFLDSVSVNFLLVIGFGRIGSRWD